MQNPYANFWRRVAAFMIDNIVLAVPMWLLTGLFVMYRMPQMMQAQTEAEIAAQMPAFFVFVILSNILFFVLFILYTGLMESSSKQATLGKMALGIKVVDRNGQRLSFWHAVGRNLGKVVSYFIMYFGFLMAAFTRRRQGLHDIMASTFVVNQAYQPGEALPEEPFHTGCLIGSIFVLLLPFIGLAAAILLPFFFTPNDTILDTPPNLRLLKSQMNAITTMDLDPGQKLDINGTILYVQDGDVFATRTQPPAFTVKQPNGQTEICCVEDDGNFCQNNAIANCQ